MNKEKYEKPVMEVVDLKDDVILTSIGNVCPPVGACVDNSCSPVGACVDNCPPVGVCSNVQCSWETIDDCTWDGKYAANASLTNLTC